MKKINDYIIERGAAPLHPLHKQGDGCVQMVETILSELQKHSDCKYNKDTNKWEGKDADLWRGAGQFLFDYLKELNQDNLKDIVTAMRWEQYIENINDIHPAEIAMCMSLALSK